MRTNADTPGDAKRAREFGAEGIGLCRTEHMFFEGDRIEAMREMIVADDTEGPRKALAKLLPMQRGDFEGIFTAMDGLPVTIRLLDPPLHEFLPHERERDRGAGEADGHPADAIAATRRLAARGQSDARPPRLPPRHHLPRDHRDAGPGHLRGRLHVAAKGVKVIPEVMVPLVATVAELKNQADIVRRVAAEVFGKAKREVAYLVGTMIELPRAALTADEIAEVAEFFSYGTNDLTQTTFGLSRDDAGRFLPAYIEQGLLPNDPFQVLDQRGVGELVQLASSSAAAPARTSRWGSAASTAASRRA